MVHGAGRTALFNAAGFDILQIGSTFGKDYLGVEARPSPRRAFRRGCARGGGRPGEGSDLQAQAPGDDAALGRQARCLPAAGKRVIAWGAGARAIAFLSAFGVTDAIPYVVDTNPNRQGKYLPVTGQRVIPPAFVVEHAPDVVLITKPSFTEEIKAQARALRASPEFESL